MPAEVYRLRNLLQGSAIGLSVLLGVLLFFLVLPGLANHGMDCNPGTDDPVSGHCTMDFGFAVGFIYSIVLIVFGLLPVGLLNAALHQRRRLLSLSALVLTSVLFLIATQFYLSLLNAMIDHVDLAGFLYISGVTTLLGLFFWMLGLACHPVTLSYLGVFNISRPAEPQAI